MIKLFSSHKKKLARVAIFVIYFWFGILKPLGLSPAEPLVGELLKVTLPSIPFETFIIGLGIFEVLIGVLILFKKTKKIAIWLIFAHMIATFLPLVLLREVAWNGILQPTLEGQYIIKNVAIIVLSIGILGGGAPKEEKGKKKR